MAAIQSAGLLQVSAHAATPAYNTLYPKLLAMVKLARCCKAEMCVHWSYLYYSATVYTCVVFCCILVHTIWTTFFCILSSLLNHQFMLPGLKGTFCSLNE